MHLGIRHISAILVMVLAAAVLDARAGEAPNDAVERTRLQDMLASGDNGMIIAVFKRHPSEALPFIDSYLEGGLAMIEKGSPTAASDAKQSFRLGIRFAKLADEALGGTVFSDYANSFASWSPSEQKSFREGQKLYREGTKLLKDDPAKAIAMLERSNKLAWSLGDTWGAAMSGAALGEAHFALAKIGKPDRPHAESASRHSNGAVSLYRELHLVNEQVAPLRTQAAAMFMLNLHEHANSAGTEALRNAWGIVMADEDADPSLRREVTAEYCAALERANLKNEADSVRAELAKLEAAPKR